MIRSFRYKFLVVILIAFFVVTSKQSVYAQQGVNDTITSFAVIYLGDTIEAKTLMDFSLYSRYNRSQMYERAKWTRLRNAIYVTFPYAKRAGRVMNDVNAHLVLISSKEERKKYIKTREKELKKEFTDPLTNLSIYQGKVLMKLINRETGNNCYEIIKEYKGSFTARFYQTVAFFFTTNLKQTYDRQGEDQEMEKIVLEVARMYGQYGG